MSEPRYIKVFIGRFQPFHEGHLRVLRASIDTSDLTVVVIGSADQYLTTKNPWTWSARRDMIWDSLAYCERKVVEIIAQPDLPGEDQRWVRDVKRNVSAIAKQKYPNDRFVITLIGCYKGADGYYLKLYKGWKLELVPAHAALNATDTRKALFEGAVDWDKDLPPASAAHIRAWSLYVPQQRRALAQEWEATRHQEAQRSLAKRKS